MELRAQFLRVIICISFIICVNCSFRTKEPIIKVENDTINFGILLKGSKIELSTRIFNVGDNTLELKQLGLSCGCTKGFLEKRTLDPGQGTTLSLVFEALEIGKVDKSIIVENNSNETFKIVKILGEVYE